MFSNAIKLFSPTLTAKCSSLDRKSNKCLWQYNFRCSLMAGWLLCYSLLPHFINYPLCPSCKNFRFYANEPNNWLGTVTRTKILKAGRCYNQLFLFFHRSHESRTSPPTIPWQQITHGLQINIPRDSYCFLSPLWYLYILLMQQKQSLKSKGTKGHIFMFLFVENFRTLAR